MFGVGCSAGSVAAQMRARHSLHHPASQRMRHYSASRLDIWETVFRDLGNCFGSLLKSDSASPRGHTVVSNV